MAAVKGAMVEFTTRVTATGQLALPEEVVAELAGQTVRVMVVVPAVEREDDAAWQRLATLELARLSDPGDADLLPPES